MNNNNKIETIVRASLYENNSEVITNHFHSNRAHFLNTQELLHGVNYESAGKQFVNTISNLPPTGQTEFLFSLFQENPINKFLLENVGDCNHLFRGALAILAAGTVVLFFKIRDSDFQQTEPTPTGVNMDVVPGINSPGFDETQDQVLHNTESVVEVLRSIRGGLDLMLVNTQNLINNILSSDGLTSLDYELLALRDTNTLIYSVISSYESKIVNLLQLVSLAYPESTFKAGDTYSYIISGQGNLSILSAHNELILNTIYLNYPF